MEQDLTVLYILAGACLVAAFITAVLRNQKNEKGRLVTKLIASLLFCSIAFLAAARRGVPVNRRTMLMLAALVLGFVGDVLLGLDHFVKENCQTFLFLVGGLPFFIGHILYIVLLLSYGTLNPWLLLILPLVPLMLYIFEKVTLIDLGKNLSPLLLYGLVLGGMMISTINLALHGGPLGRLMICPGVFFAVSDVSLFLHKFGRARLAPLMPVFSYTVMLPYYAAQAMFALSVVYL